MDASKVAYQAMDAAGFCLRRGLDPVGISSHSDGVRIHVSPAEYEALSAELCLPSDLTSSEVSHEPGTITTHHEARLCGSMILVACVRRTIAQAVTDGAS
jgi:hypothetical protein